MRSQALSALCALGLCVGCGEATAHTSDRGEAFLEADGQSPSSSIDDASGPGLDGPLDPPALANTVQVLGGSGIDLGDGVVITNWHACTRERRALTYNVPLAGGEPYVEGAPLKDCQGVSTTTVSAREVSCARNGALRVAVRLDTDIELPSPSAFPYLLYDLVFAQKALDLCILQRSEGQPRPLPPASMPIAIDPTPVRVGQEVVVAGHPLASPERVVERCEVIGETTLVRDPDRVNPGDNEVNSFAIDCETVQHGSSGSPVLDAETGALLGLVWTAECVELGMCSGIAYVTAASAWRSAQGERPVEQYSRLDELLHGFCAP